MEHDLIYPDVRFRRRVFHEELHRGSVVAFEYKDNCSSSRTGIIVMEDGRMMTAALNLYEVEGRVWVMDGIPDDISLFEANEEEKLWGYSYFLSYEYGVGGMDVNVDSFISFIDHECPQKDNDYHRMHFCREFLTYVPRMIDRPQWSKLKEALTAKLSQTGGLQFNRYQAEYSCFLIGILMIADYSKDEESRLITTKLFIQEWDQFSWMYGIGIGRVIGSRLHNFTSVVNQVGNNNRKYYLHLYLPLIEYYFDKIIEYNDDKPEKLRQAINKAKKIEELEEQRTDLDSLFGILFPKHLQEIMSSSRPARTIARMRKEMEAKEQRIKELEDAVDDITNKYKNVLEQLTNAVTDVETDKISADDLTAAFLRFPPELALSFFGSMSTLLASNPTWQKYSPVIQDLILAKLNEKEQKQDKMIEEVKKVVNKPATQNNYHLELVNKKETNIDRNYGPNIDNHDGGVLGLPNKDKKQ